MIILKAYKYRLYPTNSQKVLLEKHFGAVRWVYNWALQKKIETYEKESKSLSKFDLNAFLPKLKAEENTSWLKEVCAQSLQASIANLDSAYTSFFRDKKGFPKFKSKKQSKKSVQFPQGNSVLFDLHVLKVCKFTEGIKFKGKNTFEGTIKTVTISRTPTGKYFASVLVEEEKAVKQYSLDKNRAIGIDLGIKTLVTISDGRKIENHKYFIKSQIKLKKAQRKFAKKQKGSSNRNKQRIKVARIYETVTNQRKDHLHKITRQLVDENQVTTFCLETLGIKNMVKNRRLAKHISDCAWATFVMFLCYKAEWAGKNILRIGRFEPSSKTCNVCGQINKNLKLSDRIWTCLCGAVHDRDILAANNIKHFAFHPQNLIGQGVPKSKPVEKPLSFKRRSMKQEVRC